MNGIPRVIAHPPGIHTLSMGDYQDADALSFTGAVKLLPPSCPAKYRYWRDNPEEPTDVFDIGTAAHALVFRGAHRIDVIDAKNWQTKAAQTAKKDARATGRIALLTDQWQRVQDMAEALWRHPIASALLRGGAFEQSIFWKDTHAGIQRKARLDFLPHRTPADMYGVDYKSCANAHPDSCSKALWTYRYCQQAAWYLDAMDAMDLTSAYHTPFHFIFQEKTPPYVVTVAQPDTDAIRWGRELNRTAMGIYRECVATQRWGGYDDEVVPISLPTWAEYQLADMDMDAVTA